MLASIGLTLPFPRMAGFRKLCSGEDAQNALTVSVATTASQILALKADWLALEDEADGVLLFQSFFWIENALRHAGENAGFQPFVLTARRGGRLTALLPLKRIRKNGMDVLTGLSEPYQQYTDMLIAPNTDGTSVFCAWRKALSDCGADYVHFGQVRNGGPLFDAIKGLVPPSGERDAAPFVQLSDWPDFESYYGSLRSKTRKNMRNARNRLNREAPLKHGVFRDRTSVASIIDRTFEDRSAWLERMGLTSRAFDDADFEAFLERLKDRAGERGDAGDFETLGFCLMHGDTPISEQWGFLHRGRYYAFMSGWDPAYEQASPGKLHLADVLECCFELSADAADFMIPAVPYKMTYAADAIGVQDHILTLTLRGMIYNRVWLNGLRSGAKKLFFRLPPSIRGIVLRLAGRQGP